MTKLCSHCKRELNTELFDKNKRWKDGLQKYCKECRKRIDQQYYLRHRERLLAKRNNQRSEKENYCRLTKTALGCFICGEQYYGCLEYHHLDPTLKEGTVAVLMRSGSWKMMRKEMSKCTVLCANCHRKVHGGVLTLGDSSNGKTADSKSAFVGSNPASPA